MGVAIMSAGTDASTYANNYLPPVSGPLAWGNLESSAVQDNRRLRNWGSAGGSFALSGVAQLVAKGVSAAAGTQSSLSLGSFSTDTFTMIALVDVGVSAGIMRNRNIRIFTDANKKLARNMDGGGVTSDITAPETGAFVVFLTGDLTGHTFGIINQAGVKKATYTAVSSGNIAASIGGNNANGVAAAWAAYSCAFYGRVLTDAEMMQVANRMLARAKYLGVTVNG
ncbi:hypothetical protein ACEWFA_15045 [Klebsiella pneumoniae]|uniref:hypothetical protein n=1 Tax=Klebsiella pneumoniae TaxID=573 RepID=UPI0035BA1B0E